MATSATTLIRRTRRFLRDWPEFDALTASCTDSSTTVTVADATIYSANWVIQTDSEAMVVASGSGTTLTLKRRGARGTTAASHASGAVILNKPRFFDVEILDAINGAIGAAFPLIHQKLVDESLTISADTYEYAIPDSGISGYKIPYISSIWIRDAAGEPFSKTSAFTILRDETAPKIRFRRVPTAGATVRLVGLGPFPPLAVGDSLHAAFPPNAEDLIVWYAANYLLASGEAGRTAIDTGAMPIDQRDSANRVGASMTAANSMFQRFQIRLREAGLPPLPPHIVSVI